MKRQPFLPLATLFAALLPTGIGLVLFLRAPHLTVTPAALVVWGTGFGLFVLADSLTGADEPGGWSTYMNLAALAIWLALGLVPALALVVLGALLVAVLRSANPVRFGHKQASFPQFIAIEAARIALIGLSLLAAAGLYALAGGQLPFQMLEEHADLLPLTVALGGSIVAARLVEFTLIDPPGRRIFPLRLTRDQQPRLLIELALFPLSAVLAVVLHNTGAGAFAIIMLLVLAHLVYRQQFQQAAKSSRRLVRELSQLNRFSQEISTSLVLDDILSKINAHVSQVLAPPLFYVALYDGDTETLDFRLVMEGGRRVDRPACHVSDGPVASILHEQSVVRLALDELQATGLPLPDAHAFTLSQPEFCGLPLVAENRSIGMLGILYDARGEALENGKFDWLQAVAAQSSVAIQNARLYAESTQLARNLALINNTVRDILFNLDNEEALRIACQTAVDLAGAQKAAIFRLEAEGAAVRLIQGVGFDERYARHVAGLNAAHLQIPEQPYILHDIHNAPAEENIRRLAQAGAFRAFARFALRSGDTVIGLLDVYHDRPHHYKPATLELFETFASLITAMLDNTQLFRSLEMYAFEMTQLVNISRIATSSLETDTIAENITTIFQQLMNVQNVSIALHEPEKGNRLRVLSASGAAAMNYQITLNEEPVLVDFPELHEIVRQGTLTPRVFQRDDSDLSPELATLLDKSHEATLAVIPIGTQETLAGVILVSNDIPRHFTEREWLLMEATSNQIAAQLHNARLFHTVQENLARRLEELTLLENIARQISSTLDVSEIINNMLEAAMRATQADYASLVLITEADEFLVMSRSILDGRPQRHYERVLRDRGGIISSVAHTGDRVLVPDNRADPRYVSPNHGPYEYLSSLAVPLFNENRVVAVITVESIRPGFFTPVQGSFLKNLGDHALISIENARLLEEREYRINLLTHLRNLSLKLSSATDSVSIANVVLETALELVRARLGAIYRHNPETDALARLAFGSLDRSAGDDEAASELESLVLDVARSGKPRILEVKTTEDRARLPAGLQDYTGLVAYPIRHGARTQEILLLAIDDRRKIQEREINTIDLLATQAAGHLENAVLYERIRDARDRMRAILDSTRDGVVLMDRAGNLIETNPSAERLLGFNISAYIGQHLATALLEYAHDTNRLESDGPQAEITEMGRMLRLGSQRITRREFARQLPDQTIYIEEVGSPVLDSNHEVIGRLLTLRDVTEEKNLDAYRNEITSMAVHDLRGPLSSIISGLNLALSMLPNPEDAETVDEVLHVAMDSSDRLLDLVNSILEIGKLETRQLALSREPVALGPLLESALAALSSVVDKADLHITVTVPRDLPAIYADSEKIRRVLINLLDNASRYTPQGGDIAVIARLLPDARKVVVHVSDSGPGIPLTERARLFDKFTRVESRLPLRGNKGTGLGLTFCKLAIEAHGERIWIHDPENCDLPGTCIAFTLPLAGTDNQVEN